MDREELRKGLESIFDFVTGEEKSYSECLQRYINFISHYKTIFIFGAGIYGMQAAKILKEKLSDKEYYFIDNDKTKWGKVLYNNILCFGMEKLNECNKENSVIIIAAINSRNEIYRLLCSDKICGKKITTLKDFGFLFCKVDYEDRYQDEIWREYLKHRNDILDVFDSLEDNESRFIFYRIFINRITGKDSFLELYSPNQYFIPEMCKRMKRDEVFIDCGSYIGDTLESFKKISKNNFMKIYAFELDKNNFRRLSKNTVSKDGRVVLFNAGVGDRNENIEYAQFDNRFGSCGFAFTEHAVELGAHIATSEIKSVDSMILDGIIKEKITFVKMDIEGAEMQALKGMEKMIKRDMPKLAICIYHRPQDMWEIPMYIRNIVPTYKLYIRHHDFVDNETVLYAFDESK